MNLRVLASVVIVLAVVGIVWVVNVLAQQTPPGDEQSTKQEPVPVPPADKNLKQESVSIPPKDTKPKQQPQDESARKRLSIQEREHPTAMSIDRIEIMMANLKRIVEGKKQWEGEATILEQNFGIEALPALWAVIDYHRDTDAIARCQECADVILINLCDGLENGRSPVDKKHAPVREPVRK